MSDRIQLKAEIELPDWVQEFVENCEPTLHYPKLMEYAIKLSEMNVEKDTGGCFGALIVNEKTGEILSAGVNVVVPATTSIAHAEMTAILMAQKRLGTYDLSAYGDFVLVSSTEPCAMCYGAVMWAGVKGLVYGATGDDAREVGFDEGDKPQDWTESLRKRGIVTTGNLLRKRAVKALKAYEKKGKIIYNAGSAEK